MFVVYGVFLYKKINLRFNGNIWDLPISVYSKITNFELNNISYSKNEIIQIVEEMQYRKTLKVSFPGEYSVHDNSIYLFRRKFAFPDKIEEKILVKFNFKNDKLKEIVNVKNGKLFGFFRLDPKLIGMINSSNYEKRFFLPKSSFPNSLIKILLTIEDRFFYDHDGINFYSICRAIIKNLMSFRAVQGASTLTQQLVKNLFLNNQKTFIRKFNEIFMAILLDFFYSKDKILEVYLNEVYLGQSGEDKIHGFPLASLCYFGRPIYELSIDQQALLVGMVKGASLYNPLKNYVFALDRRNIVLKLLMNRGIISNKLYNILKSRNLGIKFQSNILIMRPAFVQIIQDEIFKKLGSKIQNFSGAKIFSTLDPILQKSAERAVEFGIKDLRKKYNINDLESAIVIVDRLNGEIRAAVGGANPEYFGFNRALNARRSIGSLSKPATFLAALSDPDNFRLNTLISDEPIEVTFDNKLWRPRNFDRHFRGKVMLIDALVFSLNVPTVNIGLNIGLKKISEILEILGAPKNIITNFPSILLGSINLTLIEIAQIFQTIGSRGNKAQLSIFRSVVDFKNSNIYNTYPSSEQVVPIQAAYLTLYGMQQVVEYGTSKLLMNKFSRYHLAGKTGTTNDLRDSWFVGIDGKYVAVVWVGRDNNRSTDLTGSSGALYIYSKYLENYSPSILYNLPPSGIINMQINADGTFNCFNDGYKTIPVWASNSFDLCK